MILQHTTPKGNLGGILKRGLLKSKSKGKMKVVWLHEADRTAWAFLHAVKRHGGRIEDVVSIAVNVDGIRVKRSSVDGLYYVDANIPVHALGDIVEFAFVAHSPLEGSDS